MSRSSWIAKQLTGARSGLAEEELYTLTSGGGDLRDLKTAHPLSRIIPDHSDVIAKSTWRVRLGHALESHRCHMIIMALVVLDLIAVFGEVMLTNVCGIERDKAAARLADESNAEALDSLEREERIHAWEGGLHRFSIAIVIALLVYVLGLMVAFGAKFFFKVWYILDAVVLSVTLILEFSLSNDSSGFLPVILSWRVLRIMHGFFVTEESSTTEVLELRKRLKDALSLASWLESDDVAALRRRLEGISKACDDESERDGEGGMAMPVVNAADVAPCASVQGAG